MNDHNAGDVPVHISGHVCSSVSTDTSDCDIDFNTNSQRNVEDECYKTTCSTSGDGGTSRNTSRPETPSVLTVDIVKSLVRNPSGLRANYVDYSIYLHDKSSPKIDGYSEANCIQRRYTDFLRLHGYLKKHYGELVDSFFFPKKMLSGNFSQKNIAHRSHAFEQYLSHLLDIPSIRNDTIFTKFFFMKELKDGASSLYKLRYRESLEKFIAASWNANIISVTSKSYVILALVGMVLCYAALDNPSECYKAALNAVNFLEDSENSLALPLLIKTVHMAVLLGQEKSKLESRIAELKHKCDLPVEDLPSLQEVLLKELDSLE